MATFITLVSFTDQGIQNIGGSPDRFEAFKSLAEKLGVTVRSAYWTVGNYDMVVIVEGPEEATTTALLKICSLGNVRTQTLRGYSADEIKHMISNMP